MPCAPGTCEFIVCVRSGTMYAEGGDVEEVIVCDRPGGAAPNMFEKAASR